MQKEKDSQTSSGEGKFPLWKKLILAFGAVVAVGSIWYDRSKKNQSKSWEEADYELIEDKPGEDSPKPLPSHVKPNDESFPLGLNSKGDRVRLIQQALNKSFNAGLIEDGIWGPKTQRVMEKVQKMFPRLVPSTVVTRQMYEVLKSAFLKGTLPKGKSLSGPLGFTVEALIDTAIWNEEGFELIDAGTRIGRHLSTNNGITQIEVHGRRIMSVKTIDIVIR